MLNEKELLKEFDEEFGVQFEEEVVDNNDDDLLELLIEESENEEVLESLKKEEVRHFLTNRCINYQEEGRYIYVKDELLYFIKEYTKKGGNLDDLRLGYVLDDVGEFYCYEISRKIYFNKNPQLYESKPEHQYSWDKYIKEVK